MIKASKWLKPPPPHDVLLPLRSPTAPSPYITIANETWYSQDGGTCPMEFVQTSQLWKNLCSALPSSIATTSWPGYRTMVFYDQWIGGFGPLIIQVWKGRCEKFMGDRVNRFPGGVGAEVGVYQRAPGLARNCWVPCVSKMFPLWFCLINPHTQDVVFDSNGQSLSNIFETTYWLNRWVSHTDYETFKSKNPSLKLPANPAYYTLEFTVNGVNYQWT